MTFTDRERSNFRGILEDVFKFGMAMASWFRSDFSAHNRAVIKAKEGILDSFAEMAEGILSNDTRSRYDLLNEIEKLKEELVKRGE